MDDEILQGYPIARFLGSEKSEGWNPDTRRCYKKALYGLLQFTRSHGAPTPELIGQWQKELQKNQKIRGCPHLFFLHKVSSESFYHLWRK